MEETIRRNPTDTLISALERIEGAEDVVIIWRKKGEDGRDEIDWDINDAPVWRSLGLIETAKLEMFRSVSEEEDD